MKMANLHCFICAAACRYGHCGAPAASPFFLTRIRIVSGTRGLAGIAPNDLLLLDLTSLQQ
jgi:hypothetical protein